MVIAILGTVTWKSQHFCDTNSAKCAGAQDAFGVDLEPTVVVMMIKLVRY